MLSVFEMLSMRFDKSERCAIERAQTFIMTEEKLPGMTPRSTKTDSSAIANAPPSFFEFFLKFFLFCA